jgi:hypothetical protein
MRSVRTNILVLTLPIILAACGGGGADEPACSSSASLALSLLYSSPLVSAGSSSVLAYKPGEAFSSTPTTTGIPASCDAVKRFSIAPQTGFGPVVALPSTVSFDPTTGTIAGTLTVPLGRCFGAAVPTYLNASNPVCDQGGVFESAVFDVTLTLPGYSPLKRSVSFHNL